MRAIDAALLCELAQGADGSIAQALAPVLAQELPAGSIDSALRQAHFLAQAAYETWSFTRLEEALGYSAARIARVWPRLAPRAETLAFAPEALANAAYADRNGNRGEASGDGWRFRGRGLFQLTGCANYALAGALDDPDSVATPEGAVRSAVAFWIALQIGEAADADDIGRVTQLVNGGRDGLADRASFKHRALVLLTA